MKFGTFKDHRSGKVAFVSHCILNINNKFPGFADVKGAYNEFIVPILEAGVGIFQMPCLETLCWGGVGRDLIARDLQEMYRAGLPLEDLDAGWIKAFPDESSRWAGWTADQMEDYLENDYEVLGIIYVANSPTCGLDHVLNFPAVHYEFWDEGADMKNLNYDDLVAGRKRPMMEEMKAIGYSDVGAFGGPLREQLQRRGINVPWVGVIPGYRGEEQTSRVLRTLGLVEA